MANRFQRIVASVTAFCVWATPALMDGAILRAMVAELGPSLTRAWAGRLSVPWAADAFLGGTVIKAGALAAATAVPASSFAQTIQGSLPSYNEATGEFTYVAPVPGGGTVSKTQGVAPIIAQDYQTTIQQSEVGSANTNFGNNAGFTGVITSSRDRMVLEGPGGGASGTKEGAAYWTIMGHISNPPPKLSNDPTLWTTSEHALTDGVDAMFAGCTDVTTTVGNDEIRTISERRTCSRGTAQPPCSVTRSLSAPVSIHRDVVRYVGNIDHTLKFYFAAVQGAATTSTCVGNNAAMLGCGGTPFQVTDETFHGDLDGTVTVSPIDASLLAPGIPYTIQVYVTPYGGTVPTINMSQTPSAANGWVGEMSFLTPGDGEQWTDTAVTVDFVSVQETIFESPVGCVGVIRASIGGQPLPACTNCTGSLAAEASNSVFECTDAALSRQVGSVTVDTSWSLSELFPQPPPSPPNGICFAARTRYQSGSVVALPCYTDVTGAQICPSSTLQDGNDCGSLQGNPSCTYASSECTDMGYTGSCVGWSDTYMCSRNAVVAGPSATTRTYSCAGNNVRCMGNECVPAVNETNSDFGRALAATATADQMAMSGSCTDTANLSTCRIFNGSAFDCKVAFFGISNCCKDEAAPISWIEYLEFGYASYEVADRAGLIASLAEQGLDIPGAWSTITNGAAAAFEPLTQPIFSAFESVSSAASAVLPDLSLSVGIEAIKQEMINEVAIWTTNTFGPTVAGEFFISDGLGNFAINLTQNSMLTTLSTAFMWISWAILLIQLFYACEEREFELSMKKQMRTCTDRGTYCSQKIPIVNICIERKRGYCCYESMFGRILHEQASLQGVHPIGSGKNLDCSGFTLAEINAINFDLVDLTEWIDALTVAGQLPDSYANMDTFYSELNVTQHRGSITDSGPTTQEMLDSVGLTPDSTVGEDTRINTQDQLWGR